MVGVTNERTEHGISHPPPPELFAVNVTDDNTMNGERRGIPKWVDGREGREGSERNELLRAAAILAPPHHPHWASVCSFRAGFFIYTETELEHKQHTTPIDTTFRIWWMWVGVPYQTNKLHT